MQSSAAATLYAFHTRLKCEQQAMPGTSAALLMWYITPTTKDTLLHVSPDCHLVNK